MVQLEADDKIQFLSQQVNFLVFVDPPKVTLNDSELGYQDKQNIKPTTKLYTKT